jgi:hypothetical protein
MVHSPEVGVIFAGRLFAALQHESILAMRHGLSTIFCALHQMIIEESPKPPKRLS